MLIKFHRGIAPRFGGHSAMRKFAIIVDSEGAQAINEIKDLADHYRQYDLDLGYVDVIITDRVADKDVFDTLASFGVSREGERKTTPVFKFAVFNPMQLGTVRDRAAQLRTTLRRWSLVTDEDARYGAQRSIVELPSVSYVGPRDYITAHIQFGYDTIVIVGANTDVLSLSNILKNYDYVGAEMWT